MTPSKIMYNIHHRGRKMYRTQIYLSEEERRILQFLSKKKKKSMSQLIREAIDQTYCNQQKVGFIEALNNVAGIWKDRTDLEVEKYIHELRKDRGSKKFIIEDIIFFILH